MKKRIRRWIGNRAIRSRHLTIRKVFTWLFWRIGR